MIRELEQVLNEVRPGARRKSSHIRIVARAARAIWNMQATDASGLKIVKGKDSLKIEQA